MKSVIAIIIMAIVIILLIMWVLHLLKKNSEYKSEIKALKEQRAQHIEMEKKTDEKINQMQTGDDSADVDASVDILHELAKKRR